MSTSSNDASRTAEMIKCRSLRFDEHDNATIVLVDGYAVVGSDDVLTVYTCGKDWVIGHQPTGRMISANLKSREEAEDLASWFWMNCTDKAGMHSEKTATVQLAAGARIGSRFRYNRLFVEPRRKRTQVIDRYKIEPGDAEKHFEAAVVKLREREKRMAADHAKVVKVVEAVEAEARRQITALSEDKRLVAEAQVALETAKEQARAIDTQNRMRHAELKRQTIELHQLRNLLVNAVVGIDPSVDLDDARITRHLRGINLRGEG